MGHVAYFARVRYEPRVDRYSLARVYGSAQKTYNPRTQQPISSVFGLGCTLIGAPLPCWILQTIRTLSYKCMPLSIHALLRFMIFLHRRKWGIFLANDIHSLRLRDDAILYLRYSEGGLSSISK
jgi:hypothetical protein